MSWLGWFLFFLFVQLIHGLGTYRLYSSAGFKSLAAFIPIYNALVLMRIINRPWWWVILLFIPIVNIMMFPVIWIETCKNFGKKSWTSIFLVIITFGLYIYSINFSKSIKKEIIINHERKESTIGSIVFAVILATIVHTYFIQPFIIPTGSLEKTLLIGDFLFVSKYHYGARVPKTVAAFPMVHDTIVGTGIRSYLNKPQLPYLRIPAIKKIERNDLVTFNWPADTVRRFFVKEAGVVKPIDKKSNYVKRCVAIPGDKLEIIDGLLYINSELSKLPYRAKPLFNYRVTSQNGISSKELLKLNITGFSRKFKISGINSNQQFEGIRPYISSLINSDIENFIITSGHKGIPSRIIAENRLRVTEIKEREKIISMTNSDFEKLESKKTFDSIYRIFKTTKSYNTSFFPNDIKYDWDEDNFGPIIIPQKGQEIELNKQTLPIYKKIIRDYEKNKLELINDKILINDVETTFYKFKMDYYWMMGDNRYNSEDSRAWGYVPENHIVGRPIFIWMSIDGINDGISNWKIRWDRVFTTIHEDGEPKSYLIHFIIFCIISWATNKFFISRNKK
tara:strand:+ start:5981 stop:7672 length:1692 start_codon:yes stop_codon:yes gene_type:complete